MAYDYRQDAFYQKETINVTWIMIWNGSTETHWWNPDEYWGPVPMWMENTSLSTGTIPNIWRSIFIRCAWRGST